MTSQTDGTRLGTGFAWMKLSIPDLAKIMPFNYWNCSFLLPGQHR